MYAGDREIKISYRGDNNMAVIILGRTMREDRKKEKEYMATGNRLSKVGGNKFKAFEPSLWYKYKGLYIRQTDSICVTAKCLKLGK